VDAAIPVQRLREPERETLAKASWALIRHCSGAINAVCYGSQAIVVSGLVSHSVFLCFMELVLYSRLHMRQYFHVLVIDVSPVAVQ
jgi:hypothetical protein